MKTPVITLWMPWANWVVLGWKEIETRLHRRFYSLQGKEIAIHASHKWDDLALELARPYLQDWQIARTERFLHIGGAIIGRACVTNARPLTTEDSHRALIDCKGTQRHGLVLAYPRPLAETILCAGKQGIWYYDIPQDNDVPLSASAAAHEASGYPLF